MSDRSGAETRRRLAAGVWVGVVASLAAIAPAAPAHAGSLAIGYTASSRAEICGSYYSPYRDCVDGEAGYVTGADSAFVTGSRTNGELFPSGTVPFIKHFSATAQAETSARELRAYAVLVFTGSPAAWLPVCCSSSLQPPKAHAYARSTEVSRIDAAGFAAGTPGILRISLVYDGGVRNDACSIDCYTSPGAGFGTVGASVSFRVTTAREALDGTIEPGLAETFTLAATSGPGSIESVADTLSFDVPFRFGLPFEIESQLDVLVVEGGSYADSGVFVSGFGEADSLDSARVVSVQVLDGSASPVVDYIATTGSGVPFPTAPEPAAAALASASVLSLAATRRARRERTSPP